MFPAYWKAFIHKHDLVKATCLIKDSCNNNYLYLLPEHKAVEESTDFFPGKEVYAQGYIPVATCEEGTGNIYCIKHNEGEFGSLYLVLHDEDDKGQSIRKMFENYEMLLPFVCDS